MQETKRVERQFASGSVLNDLLKIRYPYCPETEKVNQRFFEMLGTRELINVSKKAGGISCPAKPDQPSFFVQYSGRNTE